MLSNLQCQSCARQSRWFIRIIGQAKQTITIHRQFYTEQQKKINYTELYRLLQVSEDCNQQQLRHAFLQKAQQYHPDSGSPTANAEMFSKVEQAYRTLAQKISQESAAVSTAEEVAEKDHGIKHTAPQHRQFLSYEGVGHGTQSQREKQYQNFKVARAVETVHEYRMQTMASQSENALVFKDKTEARKHKIRNAIDRLVEDLIQESMSKGDFDNLPGKGKPLPSSNYEYNPHVDLTTHKLNEVLINNGFTPDWILLRKEITDDRERLRNHILGQPIDRERMDMLRREVEVLNAKINKFNLLVPFLYKQLVGLTLENEIKRAGGGIMDSSNKISNADSKISNRNQFENQTFIGSLFDIFFK